MKFRCVDIWCVVPHVIILYFRTEMTTVLTYYPTYHLCTRTATPRIFNLQLSILNFTPTSFISLLHFTPSDSLGAYIPHYRYFFNGQEADNEVYGEGAVLGYEFRQYDARIGRWWSVDPLTDKYPGVSPYVFCIDSPLNIIDPNGTEPIKPFAGTVQGFVAFMNSLSTCIGNAKGDMASSAMIRMSKTRGFQPANTAPFNRSDGNRYIYTRKGGWIDMAHFMFYAGTAYAKKLAKENAQEVVKSPYFTLMIPFVQIQLLKLANSEPVGETVQLGYMQEWTDMIKAKQSAFSYEDIPTDKFAAIFGAKYFNPNSDKTLSEQISDYLNNVLQATSPEEAPNYQNLPEDYPNKPTQTNHSTNPLYIEK